MLNKAHRFVSYAFCVGDVFIDVDGDLCVTYADGALSWLGMDNLKSIKGRPLSEFVDGADFGLLTSTLQLLGTKQRVGPIAVHIGANPSSRRLAGLFLSHLPGDKVVHIVAVAMSRLDGVIAKPPQTLPDSDTFLSRLPSLLADGSDADSILISLIQLANGGAPKDEDFFTRQLAALSLGGQSAAEFGAGRYAVVHEKDGGAEGGLMTRLADLTGETFESATLDANVGNGSSDAVRALVYSVRKFSDTATDIDLNALQQDFSENFEDIRERIASLRRLIKERRFHAAYQPIVPLSGGQIHHVEALVRFDTRSGSPFELITFAEEVGLIGEFDMMMLNAVTNTLKEWKDKRKKPCIAVNLSARSLTASDFQDSLMQHLEQHAALSDQLLIEVTESAQVSDLSRLSDAVKDVRGAGFKVCLDDFGAGASGFQYLKNIKVDFVKIDGSYVRGAEHDYELRAFLHAMTTLCTGLGINTIAEHVETVPQADLLRQLGADYAQGFLFGHPEVNLANALNPQAQMRSAPAPRVALP